MTQTTTTKHENLAAAVAALQSELPKIEKAETAKVETKSGGSYSYTYAGLASITERIMPLLGKHGLSFIARPTFVGEQRDRFVLAYSLMHESEGREDGEYPLPTTGTPQAIGSAITYGRRYCLCAVTGVAPEDDDDGAAAEAEAQGNRNTAQRRGSGSRTRKSTDSGSSRTTQRQTAKAPPPPLPGEDDGPPADDVPDQATQKQIGMLHASYSDLGITDRDDKLAYAANVLGHDVDSSRQLTKSEASKVIDALKKDHAEAFPTDDEAASDD